MDLSIVIPVFNEADSVRPLFSAICGVMEAGGRSFEVVFVDDGSDDSTLVILESLVAQDGRVRVIGLSRNFGQTADVTIEINFDSQVTVSPTSLTFTTENWESAQTVTVEAREDTIVEGLHGSIILHSAASPDMSYDGIAVAALAVEITDNDTILGDVNQDGEVNAADIDELYGKMMEEPPDPAADLNSDGVVDKKDIDVLVHDILNTEHGDVNLDGKVDNADFGAVLGFFGATGAVWGQGDVNGDGKVDNADFGAVLGNFGFQSVTEVATQTTRQTPIPATAPEAPAPKSRNNPIAWSDLRGRKRTVGLKPKPSIVAERNSVVSAIATDVNAAQGKPNSREQVFAKLTLTLTQGDSPSAGQQQAVQGRMKEGRI